MKGVAITMLLIVLAGSVTSQKLTGKSRQKGSDSSRESVEDLKKRPDLGVDYARVARFKLGTRKTTYHVGEMIGIDLAIINISDTPVFFHGLNRPTLQLDARDDKGLQVSINQHTTALEATSPKSYAQIEQGHLLVASFQLLAGCTRDLDTFLDQKNKIIQEEFGRGEPAYFKRLFQDSLFVDWRTACLSVKIPGKYTILAQQTNDTVLISPVTPKVRTATGTIRSTPLTLTITE